MTATNLTNLPVLESLSPRSQDEPESRNTNPQPSVVGTLLDNDLRFFKATETGIILSKFDKIKFYVFWKKGPV